MKALRTHFYILVKHLWQQGIFVPALNEMSIVLFLNWTSMLFLIF